MELFTQSTIRRIGGPGAVRIFMSFQRGAWLLYGYFSRHVFDKRKGDDKGGFRQRPKQQPCTILLILLVLMLVLPSAIGLFEWHPRQGLNLRPPD
jgi:hypothetical protein